MPTIFVHGVAVRQVSFDELSKKVLLGLRHRKTGPAMPFAAHYWGGAASTLGWGGRSIPGFSKEEQLAQQLAMGSRVQLPDLKMLLLVEPLAELLAFADTGDRSSTGMGFNQRQSQIDARNRQLSGAKQNLVERLQELLPPGSADEDFLKAAVGRALDAAVRTRGTLTIEELMPMLARAVTASACHRQAGPVDMLGGSSEWDETARATEQAVRDVLGRQRSIRDTFRNGVLSVATFALRKGLRTRTMPGLVRFLGDTMVYLNDRDKYLDALYRTVVEELRRSDTPLWIVGHSLGGIMAFDLCYKHPQLPVARLATVGSQIGLFAEADLLLQSNAAALNDGRRVVPNNVQQWINVYDENDMLSFRATGIFDRVEEEELSSGAPFPDSHGAYWDNVAVYNRIFA